MNIAIGGKTGSGKSTLVNTLLKFMQQKYGKDRKQVIIFDTSTSYAEMDAEKGNEDISDFEYLMKNPPKKRLRIKRGN
ncbi:MAG: hypothetical protein C0176_03010 [Mesoaciditoga sp.]|nr:MAG: hypothetical protein C0176_03010 [Mesoaciditoga sp.]